MPKWLDVETPTKTVGARDALVVPSDTDRRLGDTRIPTSGSVTVDSFEDAMALAIQWLSAINDPSNILRLGRSTDGLRAVAQVEGWADDGVTIGGVRVYYANSSGLNLVQPLRIGGSAFAANARIILGTGAGSLIRIIEFASAGITRFQIIEDGASLTFKTFNDAGTALFNAWSIDRLTGRMTLGAPLTTLASATGAAGLLLTPGVAPTSPTNGEVWMTAAAIFARINGTTAQLATIADQTAAIATAVANLVNSSPAALDTLKELADALADDPNFATTMNTALAARVLIATPVLGALPTGAGVSAGTTASTLASRDANSKLFGHHFIPTATGNSTAGGTTTLDVTSTGVQEFTGTGGTVKLPTTGVTRGWPIIILNNTSGTLIIQSSGANEIVRINTGLFGVFWAGIDTPTAAANWKFISPSSPSGSRANTGVQRDADCYVNGSGFTTAANPIVSATATTTLTRASGQLHIVTGTLDQTLKLPTTGIAAGHVEAVLSQTTGTVTVQSSAANTIDTVLTAAGGKLGRYAEYRALVDTPTTDTGWQRTI